MATELELDWAWRQIASRVDWNRCDRFYAALPSRLSPPEVRPTEVVPETTAARVAEFRRRTVYDRETGDQIGKVVFARIEGERDWEPLTPLPPHIMATA